MAVNPNANPPNQHVPPHDYAVPSYIDRTGMPVYDVSQNAGRGRAPLRRNVNADQGQDNDPRFPGEGVRLGDGHRREDVRGRANGAGRANPTGSRCSSCCRSCSNWCGRVYEKLPSRYAVGRFVLKALAALAIATAAVAAIVFMSILGSMIHPICGIAFSIVTGFFAIPAAWKVIKMAFEYIDTKLPDPPQRGRIN